MSFARVTIDEGSVKALEDALAGLGNKFETVMARAINKSTTQARTDINRRVRQKFNIKSKAINERVKIRKAHKGRLSADVKIIGRRFSLVRFGAKQSKKWTSYKVEKAGPRKKNAEFFIGKNPNAGPTSTPTLVWRRIDKWRPVSDRGGMSANRSRALSHVLRSRVAVPRGISLPAMMQVNRNRITTLVQAQSERNLRKELERLVLVEMSRATKKIIRRDAKGAA